MRDRGRSASDADLARVAHVLRRTSFGPFPGGVEEALRVAGSPDGVLERALLAEPVPFVPPVDIDRPFDVGDVKVLGAPSLVAWWLDRMCSDDAGLHEKMMWFWHGHFTTNASKASFLYLWHQLRTFHTHALGNFRDLTKAMVVDPAMLMWLDGADSKIEAPNENLGRELMELFTLGIGHYTEDDVRAAARGLSGWGIDDQHSVARFTPSMGPSKPDLFLGRTAVYSPDRIVDQILAQPSAAPFIVSKLWAFLIGGPKDGDLIARWGDQFRSGDYEIAPVVQTMLRSDAFRAAAGSRVRSSIEWVPPVLRVLGVDTGRFNGAEISGLGQTPYDPPNVAGWSDQSTWVSSASVFARAEFIARTSDPSRPGRTLPELGGGDDVVEAALRLASLYDVASSTRQGLKGLASTLDGDTTQRSLAVVRATLMTPEFALA